MSLVSPSDQITAKSSPDMVPCRHQNCNVPKGSYAFAGDADLVFTVQLNHGRDFHWNGIRLSQMLQKAAERPEVLKKLLRNLELV